MDNNIETLATALYTRIDDLLLAEPGLAPHRPEGSMMPAVSDAELLAMAVMSALLGFRWPGDTEFTFGAWHHRVAVAGQDQGRCSAAFPRKPS